MGRAMMAVLPPFNFLTLHYVYFIVACVVASIILYSTSAPFKNVAYVDAIFLCVSAMTGAGLNTVCTAYLTYLLESKSSSGGLVNFEYIPTGCAVRTPASGLQHSHLRHRAHGAKAGFRG
jgi:hypothetical protein